MSWMSGWTILRMTRRRAATLAMVSPAQPATAESSSDSHRMADLQKIQTVLESKVVRQRLEDFGLSQEEINARLASIWDEQRNQFATAVDATMPAGDVRVINDSASNGGSSADPNRTGVESR